MSHRIGVAALCGAALVFLSNCGGGGGGGSTPPPASPSAPAAPAGVTAATGNTQVALSWPAVSGATSYNVYSSTTEPVTTASAKTSVSTPGATLSTLTNGAPIFAAVTAVNDTGESGLSNGVCAIPTQSSTTGLTLYDPLCGSTLDGTKWISPLFSSGVANNAMVISSKISNTISRLDLGVSYQTLANVVTGAHRVTTLQANITVPAASASRAGTAEIRAVVRLLYQPPATRLNFPGGIQDQLAIEVGLRDSGGGLQAVRTVRHCDSPECNSRSASGIASSSPPAGFTANGNGIDVAASASYDTTYTVSVSLNEATGVFNWSIAGGAFGGGVSGTADPAGYLAATSSWSGVPLAGNGFLSGQAGTRIFDDVGSGSDGSISASFKNVQVGLDNVAATPFDDFSGTPGNSGPTELSVAKWSGIGGSPGNASMAMTGGKLAAHVQATSPNDNGFTNNQAFTLTNPAASTVQANVNVSACTSSFTGPRANQVRLLGNFYNDGTVGPNTAPNTNQANSNVGDVRALLTLDCLANAASYQIVRFNTQTTTTLLSNIATSGIPVGTVTGNVHKLKMSWDPAAHTFTFQVDNGAPVVVDPTQTGPNINVAAPVAGPANAPTKQLGWSVLVGSSTTPSATGATSSMDLTVNNVFTAP